MIIRHPEYLHQIEIDERSGLPTAIVLPGADAFRVDLPTFELTLSVNGQEVRSPTGGIDCVGAETLASVAYQGRLEWASGHEGDACRLNRYSIVAASGPIFTARRHASPSWPDGHSQRP